MAALVELQRYLPNLAAAIGPSCSSDVVEVSSIESRAITGYDGMFLSASSTAPSAANDTAYPLVSRAATNEMTLVTALAEFVQSRGWQHIGVIHDDSVWGSESAIWFVATLKKINSAAGRNTYVLNHLNKTISAETTGFKFSKFMETPYKSAKNLLLGLRAADVRITVMFTQPKVQRWLFRASYLERINFGEGYLWMTTWMTEAAFFHEDTQIDYEALRGAEGLCGIVDGLPVVTAKMAQKREEYASRWATTSNPKGCARTIKLPANHSSPLGKRLQLEADQRFYCDSDGDPREFPSYAANMIDGVVSYAMAMDKQYLTAPLDAKQLYQNVLDNEPFHGLTGKYVIDHDSGDLAGGLSLKNIQFNDKFEKPDGDRSRRYITVTEMRASVSEINRESARGHALMGSFVPHSTPHPWCLDALACCSCLLLTGALLMTSSHSKAEFVSIGSYTKQNGLRMLNGTDGRPIDIVYAGRTLATPVDKDPVVVANASKQCCNDLGWGTNHYASPKYGIGTSRDALHQHSIKLTLGY